MEEIDKKSKKICAVVKDLLPLYMDDALREESREFVEEHLKECQDCLHYKMTMEQSDSNSIPMTSEVVTDGDASEKEEAARIKIIAGRLRSRRRKIILTGLALLLLVYAAFTRVLQTGMIIGGSMEPTYQSGKNVIVNRLAYLLFEPDRGDVVFYHHSGGIYIKRIVGIPGDTIEIVDHELMINGKPAHMKHIDSFIEDAGNITYPVVLGKNEYFVLGDNLDSSQDSRYKICGNITREEIMGKVIGKSISMIRTTEYTKIEQK